MSWIQVIFAMLLAIGAFAGWLIFHRRMRGDDAPLFGGTRRRPRDNAGENELEAFITAYTQGKVDPVALSDSSAAAPERSAGQPPVEPAPMPVAAPRATSTPVASPGPSNPRPSPTATGNLLRPEVKLAYLTFRSGLRDHHVFVNVRLGDLGYGTAVGTIDLLVCNNSFDYVAAIDVCVTDPPEDIAKATFLRNAGLRHLTIRARQMPKPGELRSLIYGQDDR